MKTDVQDISPTRKTISITASSEEVSEQEAKLINDFQRQAKIPGFRPGKAPKNMVRQRFAKDIQQELKKRVVSQAHQVGVSGAEFEVFNIVELDEGDVKGGQGATITFTVDIIPEFELPTYEGLKVTNTPTDASDEEVAKMLDQILGQRAEYNIAEKAAEKGDYVQCTYVGKIDTKSVADLVPEASIFGSQANTWEEAGNEDAPGVRAIVDGLVGMKAG
ncbi:MAG: trigger factor family protein, partial [Verrucomicrobiota bacterium]|nr:trigger factor family protein [Verrucomicrobiota bacterium]